MSVHAGIWNFDGEPVDRAFLANTSHSVAKYGPDGEKSRLDGSVGMLYRPFHTTLESRTERQPHVSRSGRWLTWDGRLDNRDELIATLGDLTDDQTDVAIVAAAIDRWDTDAFPQLRGDWSVAVWNARKKELVLARDYMGIRHLFYYPRKTGIKWCSHLAPLAEHGGPLTLCDEYIAGYLSSWPDSHRTPYEEILSVPPGQFVRIRCSNITTRRYWAFKPKFKTRYKADAAYEEHFRHLLRQSVRRRLRTNGPILADLSGGFDSSSIVCMADHILAKDSLHPTSVDTFSFYEPDEPAEDDFPYLKKVEERRGRPGYHAEVRQSSDAFPLKYSTFVATPGFGVRLELNLALSEANKDGKYRVILAGNGGDEFLGQAFDPRVQMADLLAQFRLIELAKYLTEWSLLFRRPWIQLLLETGIVLLPNWMRVHLTRIAKKEPWIDRRFARTRIISSRRLEASEGKWWWPPSLRDSFQTCATVARKMSYAMPSTVERRYPYLDQDLIEFVTSIPTNQLIRPGERRSLMRRALIGLLPAEILSRKTKAGSSRCVVTTVTKHWREVESIAASPLSARLGYIDQVGFNTELTRTRNGQISRSVFYLLRAMSLEFWLRDVVARGVISLPAKVLDGNGSHCAQSPIRTAVQE